VLIAGWWCLLTDCLLAGCVDYDGEELPRRERPEEPLFVRSLTRTDADGMLKTLDGMGIYVMMLSENNSTAPATPVRQTGSVTYGGNVAGQDLWNSTLTVKAETQYRLFGFMPADITTATDAGDMPSVAVNSGQTQATMVISKMAVVSDRDVCAIIGVKDPVAQTAPITPGAFGYTATYHTDPTFGNGYFVALKADHLYAAVDFRFQVAAEYSRLRKIVLKQLWLKSPFPAEFQAQITLNMATEGAPVASDAAVISNIGWTPAAPGTDSVKAKVLDVREGVELTGTAADIRAVGYVAPDFTGGLTIESVYDIYDLHGNLLRKDCHAQNNIASRVNGTVAAYPKLKRGEKRVITLTVKPSYLYVLGDEDPEPEIE